MECSVCFDVYDVDGRRPKVLPCGHTFCLPCLQNPNFGNECPQDRKAFRDNPMNFPDNFALLAEMPARADEPWCETCGLRFRGACADAAHRPCSVRQRRVQQEQRQADQQVLQDLQQGLQTLQQGLQDLQQGLQDLQLGHLDLQLGLQDVQREMQDMRQTQDQLLRKVEDLQLTGTAAPPPPSLEIDVWELSPSEKNDLLVGDRLARVRKLTGLHCYNVERSMAVLMKLNPHVEELGLIGAQLPQLRFVEGMTSLRKLDLDVSSLIEHAESYEIPDLPLQLEELEVEGFSRNLFYCLPKLPKLRRLVLTTPNWDTVVLTGVAWQCGLQYLNFTQQRAPYFRWCALTPPRRRTGSASSVGAPGPFLRRGTCPPSCMGAGFSP
ncbi:uncharacterized protein LOC117651833 [Thrips palmi]|uniref:Uncharacterized protein LOC117651833 n=1 Tax=Thrips palmi TaxID=161013 RepID=A0A6P9A6Q9_THRPL|nr:uncharacterized protein LOC117651833 [Thrips palmi]